MLQRVASHLYVRPDGALVTRHLNSTTQHTIKCVLWKCSSSGNHRNAPAERHTLANQIQVSLGFSGRVENRENPKAQMRAHITETSFALSLLVDDKQ